MEAQEDDPVRIPTRLYGVIPGYPPLFIADVHMPGPVNYSEMLWDLAQELVRVSAEHEGKDAPLP